MIHAHFGKSNSYAFCGFYSSIIKEAVSAFIYLLLSLSNYVIFNVRYSSIWIIITTFIFTFTQNQNIVIFSYKI